jgi:hypothetical protein
VTISDLHAIHEAAHAFVAEAFGLAVSRVQLGDPRFDFVTEPPPERRLDHARVLMAGCEAEAALLGCEPIGSGSDNLEIERLLCDADDEAALRRQVRLFVDPAVTRIAAALLRERTLTGAQITRLMKGEPHAHPRPNRSRGQARVAA